MNEKVRKQALAKSQKALDLIAQSSLSKAEQDQVVKETVANFNTYVNPSILEIRKSCANENSDYQSVEWDDADDTFKDVHGREFIDCLGGFGIFTLGHRNPTVLKAVTDQLKRQALHSQEILDPLRGYLSELLAIVSPGDMKWSFLVNSGTEAVEGSLKFAKLYQFTKKPNHNKGVISTLRAFHGKSMGSLSVSGKDNFREAFYPHVPGARFIPYGDADALDKELKICDMIGFDIAAFIAEPVQGEAGVIVPPDDYFPKVREICDKWGVVMIVDEVQTGMGRTGELWGIDNWGVVPDIMALAKSFGGGVMPAGAIILRPELYEPMFEDPWLHTSTFGGNPLACAAAIAALHATLAEDIPGQAKEKGKYLKAKLEAYAAEYPDLIHEVRGLGLLIGLEFIGNDMGFAIGMDLFDRGVVVSGTMNNAKTVRFEPPANITYAHLDYVVASLGEALADVRVRVKKGELE